MKNSTGLAREKPPLWVWAVLLAYGLSAFLFVATSYMRTWLWLPWAFLTAAWGGLRIMQARPRMPGESREQARNRNAGRDRSPFTVHVISAVILLVMAWYALAGSRLHPLPGMPHAPLLHL